MSKTINLRQHRKRKARAEKEQTAAEQRALHGRTAQQKQADSKREAAARALWQGHRRDGEADTDESS